MLKWIITTLILPITYLACAQDGSLIANTKTSNIDYQIKNSFNGLWEVKLVTVADQSMTPVAKWFQINEDGTLASGNGWLQNVESNWEFKEINNELIFITDGIPDEYGAFIVTVDDNSMTWARIEEGQNVKVQLEKTIKRPMAPWDKIVGVWKWIGMESRNVDTNEINISDVEPDWTRIRWDRRYDTFDAEGIKTESGIWHFDAHRPVLTIFDAKDEKYVWQIEFIDDQMVWTSEQKGDVLQLTFESDIKIGNGN